MSNYAQIYLATIEGLDKKYAPFHNLFLLKGINAKVKCY